jgi:transcription antitermination factor NusG
MTWFICRVNPNCHRRAEAGLSAIGYQSFWPRLRKWVSHARTKVAKEYPILGRYVFVEIPDQEFYRVRCVNGVEGLLVDFSGCPVPIPPEIVWAFRERYMRGEWDFVSHEGVEYIDEHGEVFTRKTSIPTGALIRIMEGEFADLLTVVRGRGNGKIKFLPPGKNQFYFTREANVRAA